MKKIAIVHEWLITYAGSERVIEQLLQVFPEADLFALFDFLPPQERGFLRGKPVHTSFLQNFPFINRKNYRLFLPLMPLAVEQLDFSDYEIVISNCHAVSKGVITGPDQLHIGYIHSPMRYAWDMQGSYLKQSGFGFLKGAAARLLLHYLRAWDVAASNRPDVLIANSRFIARRVEKIYRRPSRVLYPPVDTDKFTPGAAREDFYLAASRLVPYKRFDLILEAFAAMPDKRLIVIGDGPDAPRLKKVNASNVRWLGYQPDEVLRDHMRRCKAFIFAAKEDFGIMPVEAQACGAPVIAFGEGGLTETIVGPGGEAPTGVFFRPQTAEALREAIQTFEANADAFTVEHCRANAERFSIPRFRKEIVELAEEEWRRFEGATSPMPSPEGRGGRK
ncbi:MAG: glycosyltransferase family 4 protein [Chloroflexota bacterium]